MAVPISLILQLAEMIGGSASKYGGSGKSGYGQIFSNIGNRDVKNKGLRAFFNMADPGGGFSNTIASFGGNRVKLFGGKPVYSGSGETDSNVPLTRLQANLQRAAALKALMRNR